MDYCDQAAGISSDYFWFRAKLVLIERMLALARLPANARLLSLGAGTGEELEVLRRRGTVFTLDLNPRALALIDPATPRVCGDAAELPFVSQSFDAVCLFDVLEHLPDDTQALHECARVLRPGGCLLLSVPAFPALFSGHDRALGHYRRYTRSSLRLLLQYWEEIAGGWWAGATFPGFVISRWLNCKRDTLDYPRPRPWLNRALYRLLALEARAAGLRHFPPIGSTLYSVCRRR